MLPDLNGTRSMKRIKILYLYSELAEYFVACIRHLEAHENVEIHIVKWPVHSDAPFQFSFPDNVSVYDRERYSGAELLELAETIDPDLIFCCGWMDREYIRVCKVFNDNIPVIGGMDNQWTGSAKQQIARMVSPFTIQRYFSHMFVAGSPQREYARKLGFADDKILEGYYSADVNLFNKIYEKNRRKKRESFPHRFLYVGRYSEEKGVRDLWAAFIELQQERASDWELWCCGTGVLDNEKPERKDIQHFGFLQPSELAEVASRAGVFLLPSYVEPWGVVVHEFAAAGFPLICSDNVGAASKFLEHGQNGFLFSTGSRQQLKKMMGKIMDTPDDQLFDMGEQSVRLASAITPETWSRVQMRLVEDKRGG